MLTAFSRMIGLKKDNASSQSTVALQSQINKLEQGATIAEISRSTNRKTGMSAVFGAAGGGIGGYLLSTLTVTVAAVAAPVTAAATGAVVGAVALGTAYRMLAGSPKSNHHNTVKKINAISKNLVDSKIKGLAETKAGEKIDFVLNRLSKVEEEATDTTDKKTVGLVTLDKPMVRKLLSSLKSISKLNPRVKIKKIDISSAGLTKRDMTNLLSAGLGSHDTEHLILSGDKHSEAMIKLLKIYIVDRKTAFQSLKILDLSSNAITESSLNDIRDIVNYLRLRELNISDNPDIAEKALEQVKGRISLILTDERNRLVSLRKINLANTGLVEDQAEDVAKFIEQAVFLEELNIDRNDGLNLDAVEAQVKEKGAVKSVSLQDLITEFDEHIDIDEVFSERDDVLGKISASKKADEPWAVFLLNYKLTHKSFPVEVAKYLEGTVFNKINIDELITKIQRKRTEHLGVQEKSTILITESELTACFDEKLPEFYQKVRDKNERSVDPKLIAQINESKVKKGLPSSKVKSSPRTKPNTARTRCKVTTADDLRTRAKVTPAERLTTRGKATPAKIPTPTGKQVQVESQAPVKAPAVVKIPNVAPILTQYNASRTAKLHADINATLDADQMARNPLLSFQTPRV